MLIAVIGLWASERDVAGMETCHVSKAGSVASREGVDLDKPWSVVETFTLGFRTHEEMGSVASSLMDPGSLQP